MPANFLHGVETINIEQGGKPIRVVKSAVIGIVGTAPIFQAATADQTINKPVLILNDVAAAKYFGSEKSAGYTIPKALKAAFKKGAATVVVVNVFDPATHKSSVAAEAKTLGADKTATLEHPGVANVVVKNQAGTTTYVKDTDYTLDAATGVITGMGATLIAGAQIKVDYDYADPTKVLAADIIGTVDGAGNRTGMQALLDCYSLFGFKAKIIIAPSYSTQNSVATELVALAGKVKGVAYLDAPVGTTVQQAITGRGPSGTINFQTSSRRAMLCFPAVKVYDAATASTELQPFSQFLAGIRAWRDNENGYWWSSSNTEIAGIVGIERPLTAEINDPSSEVNALNEVGITTVFNSFGTGFRVWGNRTAAWPAETGAEVFECVQRTGDVIGDSIEYSMLQHIDKPLNGALIDAIVESVRGFLRKLIGDGAILDGTCWYDPADNPSTELALGHVTFRYDYMPPTPAERITFKRTLNLDYLKNLGGSQ
ncbi:phage tail sheath subtilisin-like domain-containing protein [Geobacter sp.]|uniref:phage tail sheath subtilisin-like domain-containing protein n=1 Tax=Geobacter sp. TaxID=46610 RepID=UPI002601840A|nr:phage tail sheath subtilisin-like domain-containing protein [Geobacter sp.]